MDKVWILSGHVSHELCYNFPFLFSFFLFSFLGHWIVSKSGDPSLTSTSEEHRRDQEEF